MTSGLFIFPKLAACFLLFLRLTVYLSISEQRMIRRWSWKLQKVPGQTVRLLNIIRLKSWTSEGLNRSQTVALNVNCRDQRQFKTQTPFYLKHQDEFGSTLMQDTFLWSPWFMIESKIEESSKLISNNDFKTGSMGYDYELQIIESFPGSRSTQIKTAVPNNRWSDSYSLILNSAIVDYCFLSICVGKSVGRSSPEVE